MKFIWTLKKVVKEKPFYEKTRVARGETFYKKINNRRSFYKKIISDTHLYKKDHKQ